MTQTISITVFKTNIPLNEPYVLSKGIFNEYTSYIFLATIGTIHGVGEFVPAPIYMGDDSKTVEASILKVVPRLSKCTGGEVLGILNEISFRDTHYLSGLRTAVMGAMNIWNICNHIKVPVVAILDKKDDKNLEEKLEMLFDQGYRTIKIKLGPNIDDDIDFINYLDSVDNRKFRFRLDFNGSYDLDKIIKFVELVSKTTISKQIQHIEQPLHGNRWSEMKKLCSFSHITVALDESISCKDDIGNAYDIGVKTIKLKLRKCIDPINLLGMALYAVRLGIDVILGDGISTGINSLIESSLFSAHSGLFLSGIETNGFLKIQEDILVDSPFLSSGAICYSGDNKMLLKNKCEKMEIKKICEI